MFVLPVVSHELKHTCVCTNRVALCLLDDASREGKGEAKLWHWCCMGKGGQERPLYYKLAIILIYRHKVFSRLIKLVFVAYPNNQCLLEYITFYVTRHMCGVGR